MKKNIQEAARVIRSKNSGPYELTLDIMFKDRRYFDLFRARNIINSDLICRLYRIPQTDILGILYFEPAQAVKITMKRRLPSGALGDGDIYGAQQHAPLLEIEFEDS
jgi:hypothetical protein